MSLQTDRLELALECFQVNTQLQTFLTGKLYDKNDLQMNETTLISIVPQSALTSLSTATPEKMSHYASLLSLTKKNLFGTTS